MIRQLILVAALVALAHSHKHEMSEEDKKIHEDCAKELGFDSTKHEKGQNPSAEDMKKFGCMMKCADIKKGLISEDGVLNVDKIQEKFNTDEEKVKAAIESCKDKTGDDDCSKITSKMFCVHHELHPRKNITNKPVFLT